LVSAVTPDGQVVQRSNVSPDVLRTFGQDLINELETPPKPDDIGGCMRIEFLLELFPHASEGPPLNVRHLMLQHRHRQF
jgi:hypothetical protein